MKKEAAVQAIKGEKLPNTASNSIIMMTLSACLVAIRDHCLDLRAVKLKRKTKY